MDKKEKKTKQVKTEESRPFGQQNVKPKLSLSEFEVYGTTSNPVTGDMFGEAGKIDVKKLNSKFEMKVISLNKLDLEFDLIGFDPAIVNALRRILLSDVPSMAIEKVHMWQNTSIMQDEVLAHRLGLLPLTADPRQFSWPPPDWSPDTGTEKDTLEFSLAVRCTRDSAEEERHVTTRHLEWRPRGDQSTWLTDPGPHQKDILINKLRPGHEMDIKLFAVKGVGRDHAKFSPVATAFYRLMPHIEIRSPVVGEEAFRLQKCFSPGVIEVVDGERGKEARVADPRHDTCSRNVYRYEELAKKVWLEKVPDHFIFSVESVGANTPDDLVSMAWDVLIEKYERGQTVTCSTVSMSGPQPVIALLDMDCFYVQVETREQPRLRGRPAAVVQYNAWRGGGIIAVNYEARAHGVTRNMRGEQAREVCPDIELVTVPVLRDKADLGKYRRAGREVIEVLLDSGATVERASIDEAYLDLTSLVERRLGGGAAVTAELLPNTWLAGDAGERAEVVASWCEDIANTGTEDEVRLAMGAVIMEEVRAEVERRTQFRCSAGVAHCKTLAKLCCGLHKPNKQTVVPASRLAALYETVAVTKVRGLGGKLGEAVTRQLGVETMAELARLSLANIAAKFEAKTAGWLHQLARGRDGETVKERELPKSVGCGKNFPGKQKLDTRRKVEERLGDLVAGLLERLEEDREEHGRLATGLTVGVAQEGLGWLSRAGPLQMYSASSVFSGVMSILGRLNTAVAGDREAWSPALLNISLSAGKFVSNCSSSNQTITSFFAASSSSEPLSKSSVLEEKEPALPEPIEVEPHKSSIKSFFNAATKSDTSVGSVAPDFETVEAQKSKSSIKSFFGAASRVATSDVPSDSTNCDNDDSTKHTSDAAPEETLPHEESEDSNLSTVDITELIPSLDTYDPSILSLLPKEMRDKALKRVEELKEDKVRRKSSTGPMSAFLTQQISTRVHEDNAEVAKPDDDEDLVECEQCGRKVSAFTLPEHLDWHFAVTLSKQSNPSSSHSSKAQLQVTGKRKRESSSGFSNSDNMKKSCQKGISNYFVKS